jgi:ribosomal-protein-alanine N-acetyltransferase
MQNNYITKRLMLTRLSPNDTGFIAALVNTPEWLKFIGDRNVSTQDDARVYVEKLNGNPNVNFWVVKLQNQNISIGVITFIKRDYLEHYDIGFAFLSKYAKNGYAYEATMPILNDALNNPNHQQILATTVKENTASIKLLQKLGFRYEKEIEIGKDLLLLYSCHRSS